VDIVGDKMNNKDLENKVISGLAWKFMERICAQVVTFVVSIVLARLLMRFINDIWKI
jgi:hypothetical protein